MKKIVLLLKSISENLHCKIRTKYSKAKVHEPVRYNRPPFCPVLLATGTSTYDLAKFPVPILKPLIENEYTFHDSISSASAVGKYNSNNLNGSLDVECLLTDISFEHIFENIMIYF